MMRLGHRLPTSTAQRASARRTCVTRAASAADLSRRQLLEGLAIGAGSIALGAQPALAGRPATVETYLPPAGVEDFVLFVPDAKKTPVRALSLHIGPHGHPSDPPL
jgi:hypothetical protein